jgi:glycerophosphoryl diester phosphodiesterase
MPLRAPAAAPRRIVLVADCVGGVWQYSLELAAGLAAQGVEVVLAVAGPPPGPAQRAEAAAIPELRVRLLDAALDWMAQGEEELAPLRRRLLTLVASERVDLVHLNGAALGDLPRFYIETKSPESAPGMEAALVALLSARGLADGALLDGLPVVIVQSFSARSLHTMEELAPAIPRVLLVGAEAADTVFARLDEVAARVHGLGPTRRVVSADVVRRAHAAGLALHPYTVNDEREMRRLLDLGADGMFSDRPDVLMRVR